jgi:diaminohydroxyphosphoribosylaminopyrimidine deaminase / 5-amino-6-(5-phosphoribosylamino)uracil reductase
MKHIDYIRRCIHLAEKGRGWVNPNPMVGALLVHDGIIIAEGYHKAYGHPHAEVHAINQVHDPEILKSCTLYVSLEPCSHFGKTPPCADLIIASKIPRVVVATQDPNPLVSGQGIQKLRKAGIEVVYGILEEEAQKSNRFFETFHRKNRPYIILKWAETADGFMAPIHPEEIFISGEDTRLFTHALRKEVSAVLVGVGTWEIDRPKLNDRYHGGPQPIRIIWDPFLKGSYEPVSDEEQETWILNETQNHAHGSLRFVALPGVAHDFTAIWDFLYHRQINSVLIEGGAIVLGNIFQSGIYDQVFRFVSHEICWGEGKKAPVILDREPIRTQHFNDSELRIYE